MSGYEARCPSCGGAIVFALGSTLLRVCNHCGSAVARKGANLADYGKVAQLFPTPSVLALGQRGGFAGAGNFELVGRLQLDHGAGAWDEWLLGFGTESWAWLAEAQGQFWYTAAAPLPPVPRFGDLKLGEAVDLGPSGVFVVNEAREARFLSARGELPVSVAPGALLRYADLSGPGEGVATIDYGEGDEAVAVYVGRSVSLDEIGLAAVADEDRRVQAAGQSLACPQCAGPLEIRTPKQTQRLGCPWCGSLLDTTRGGFQVLAALDKPPFDLLIPLGSEGTLDGARWVVTGAMERSVTVEDVRYPWREYLLHSATEGFRWLVEAKGHWSFVKPAKHGIKGADTADPSYEGQDFKHFQGGTACVDHVIGEFYWAVASGDKTETADHISPPRMLSREESPGEVTWSLGTYMTGDDVWKAFALEGRPPKPSGVAPHQPSPWIQRSKGVNGLWLLTLGLLAALYLWFAFGSKAVLRAEVLLPVDAVSGAPENAWFSDPFTVDRRGNLQVEVRAPVSNAWLFLDGALINEGTGEVDDFDVEASYYFGSDGDGSWTEGKQRGLAYVGAVRPGRYVLRIAPQWEGRPPVRRYLVAARSRVPRLWHWALAAIALSAGPVVLVWARFRFEMVRWAESDHPWMTATDDDSGDD